MQRQLTAARAAWVCVQEWNKTIRTGFSPTIGERRRAGGKMLWHWTWSIFLLLLIPCIFLNHRLRSSAGEPGVRTGSLDADGTFVEALVNGALWAAALTALLGFVV